MSAKCMSYTYIFMNPEHTSQQTKAYVCAMRAIWWSQSRRAHNPSMSRLCACMRFGFGFGFRSKKFAKRGHTLVGSLNASKQKKIHVQYRYIRYIFALVVSPRLLNCRVLCIVYRHLHFFSAETHIHPDTHTQCIVCACVSGTLTHITRKLVGFRRGVWHGWSFVCYFTHIVCVLMILFFSRTPHNAFHVGEGWELRRRVVSLSVQTKTIICACILGNHFVFLDFL